MRPDQGEEVFMIGLPRVIAGYLKDKLNLSDEQEEVALYSLEVFIYTGFTFLGTGLVGWLFGCLQATLIIAFTIFALRCFSGGAHSNSPACCIILSILVIPLSAKIVMLMSPFIPKYFLAVLVVSGFLISLFITYRLAPVDTPAKPVSPESQRRKLRLLSNLTVVLVFILQGVLFYSVSFSEAATPILALEAGLLWQAFSLTNAGRRFFTGLDNLKIS